MRKFTLFIFLSALCMLVSAQKPWLHVEGNQIKDPDGNPVTLRGVSLLPHEYNDCSYCDSKPTSEMVAWQADASRGWFSRVVRIGVCGSYTDPVNAHATHLQPYVQQAIAQDQYVIIDLHLVSNYGTGGISQASVMAFWQHVAPLYADVPNVIFEVFNEPVNPDNWATWKAFIQPVVDSIRAVAPNNLILMGGPQWSTRVNDAAADPIDDDNTVYVYHIYPNQGSASSSNLNAKFGNAANTIPVIISEFGWNQDPDYSDGVTFGTTGGWGQQFRNYMDANSNISWVNYIFDNYWKPQIFDWDWNIMSGENQGQFIKNWLFDMQNHNQPGDDSDDGTQTPFVTLNIPGIIQAEDFDNGGQDISYHDADIGNSGGEYRDTDVDIGTTSDTSGGYVVGYINNNEWLEYTIDSVVTGIYDINVRYASDYSASGKSVALSLEGQNIGTVYPTLTGGWENWENLTLTNVSIPGGNDLLFRLDFGGGSFNVNYVEFIKKNTTGNPILTNIVLSPSADTINVDETLQFTATGYDQYGNVMVFSPNWSATGGAVSSSGLYTGNTVGNFIVSATSGSITGSANVTVKEIFVPVLTSIDVTPPVARIEVGEMYQFTATGYDQAGGVMVITPQWSATGGSINSSGIYTGTVEGNYTINATLDSVTGTASIIVDTITPQLGEVYEAENTSRWYSSATGTIVNDIMASEGEYIRLNADASGDFAEYTINHTGTADYDFYLGFVAGPDKGICQMYRNGNPVGSPIDMYSATVEYKEQVVGEITLYTGPQKFRFTVAGKNSSSSGYRITQDYFMLVDPSASVLTNIEVSPSTVTINTGGTHQFSATGYDQNGNTVSFTPNWSTTGGSINSSGLYTGDVEGIFTVSATSGSISGSATITVEDTSVPGTVYEAESTSRWYSSATGSIVNDTVASNGSYIRLNADGTGDFAEYTINHSGSVEYGFYLGYVSGPDRGISQMYRNNSAMGDPIDMYSPVVEYKEAFIRNITFYTGPQKFNFTVTGKNSNSSGYRITQDYFILAETTTKSATQATGISKNEINSPDVSIMPNPASEYFNVVTSMRGYSVKIYNSVGALIMRKNNLAGTSVFSTSDLQKGIYLIKINNPEQNITKRIVIK